MERWVCLVFVVERAPLHRRLHMKKKINTGDSQRSNPFGGELNSCDINYSAASIYTEFRHESFQVNISFYRVKAMHRSTSNTHVWRKRMPEILSRTPLNPAMIADHKNLAANSPEVDEESLVLPNFLFSWLTSVDGGGENSDSGGKGDASCCGEGEEAIFGAGEGPERGSLCLLGGRGGRAGRWRLWAGAGITAKAGACDGEREGPGDGEGLGWSRNVMELFRYEESRTSLTFPKTVWLSPRFFGDAVIFWASCFSLGGSKLRLPTSERTAACTITGASTDDPLWFVIWTYTFCIKMKKKKKLSHNSCY